MTRRAATAIAVAVLAVLQSELDIVPMGHAGNLDALRQERSASGLSADRRGNLRGRE